MLLLLSFEKFSTNSRCSKNPLCTITLNETTFFRPELSNLTKYKDSVFACQLHRTNFFFICLIFKFIYLPKFRANYQNGPLVISAAKHTQSIKTSNLFGFVFIIRLSCFCFVSRQGPNFNCSCRRQTQNHIV